MELGIDTDRRRIELACSDQYISDEEMQNIKSQVLSGEANSPGSFSKRTVNLLSDLDKKDAELFQTLCRFVWLIGLLVGYPN